MQSFKFKMFNKSFHNPNLHKCCPFRKCDNCDLLLKRQNLEIGRSKQFIAKCLEIKKLNTEINEKSLELSKLHDALNEELAKSQRKTMEISARDEEIFNLQSEMFLLQKENETLRGQYGPY